MAKRKQFRQNSSKVQSITINHRVKPWNRQQRIYKLTNLTLVNGRQLPRYNIIRDLETFHLMPEIAQIKKLRELQDASGILKKAVSILSN